MQKINKNKFLYQAISLKTNQKFGGGCQNFVGSKTMGHKFSASIGPTGEHALWRSKDPPWRTR